MNINYAKAVVTACMSMLAALLGVLYVPVLLMVACNVIDYITGLFAAKYRTDGGISSYRSMRGIIKKVTMWRSEERRVGKECRSRWSPYH